MIRRIFHIMIACLVLIATNGVVLSKHYCSGELRSTSLFQPKSCCDQTGKKKSNCCDTEVELHRVECEFQPGAVIMPHFVLAVQVLPVPQESWKSSNVALVRTPGKLPDRPPRSGTAILVVHQVFRI